MMPPATIALMNPDEVTDLIAYLVSGGDEKHAVFRRKCLAEVVRSRRSTT